MKVNIILDVFMFGNLRNNVIKVLVLVFFLFLSMLGYVKFVFGFFCIF